MYEDRNYTTVDLIKLIDIYTDKMIVEKVLYFFLGVAVITILVLVFQFKLL